MVFTIEPMVNLGGYEVVIDSDDDWTVAPPTAPSAQFEHTILVTKDGCGSHAAPEAAAPVGEPASVLAL